MDARVCSTGELFFSCKYQLSQEDEMQVKREKRYIRDRRTREVAREAGRVLACSGTVD